MSGGDSFALVDWQIRLVLPHRSPVLQLDRVTACTPALDRLEAVKGLASGDPMMRHSAVGVASGATLSCSAAIEAAAQCCGLLLRLRWLASEGADLNAFAAGDASQVLNREIPRSVLAESEAKFAAPFLPGRTLRLATNLVLSRGEMHRFEATAEPDTAASGSGGPAKTTMRIMLNFPRIPAAGNEHSKRVLPARETTC